jgi:hypothetical protein
MNVYKIKWNQDSQQSSTNWNYWKFDYLFCWVIDFYKDPHVSPYKMKTTIEIGHVIKNEKWSFSTYRLYIVIF